MIARIPSAVMRGVLVATLVATPSLLLPEHISQANDIIALMAILCGLLTFIEYNTAYPSFVEFRDAPPLNRIRFVALFAMVFCLTVMFKDQYEPSTLTLMMVSFSNTASDLLNFPFSPIRLMVLVAPSSTTLTDLELLQRSASLAYAVSLMAMATFGLVVRFTRWPIGAGAFNVWVNLPLFDPTTGGDVVQRLRRDGRVNVIFGALLPFAIPAALMIISEVIAPHHLPFATKHDLDDFGLGLSAGQHGDARCRDVAGGRAH